MRIAHYLAKSGLGSRRKTEELVRKGEVTVNGVTVTDLFFDIKASDRVEFQGNEVQPLKPVYYVLNKPIGYTCSLDDIHAEHLVSELVPAEPPVWTVGRLDRDTEGLIIMTNDGDLTYRLTHPKFEKEKEYEVTIDHLLTDKELDALRKGVTLEDGQIKPDNVEFDGKNYQVIIHSGKKRIIRRLFSHFGRDVLKLKRVRIDQLQLGDLKVGEWRLLSSEEKEELDL